MFNFNLDLDECKLKLHGCQQNCENTPGSFKCKCTPGFMLDTDGKSCLGMSIKYTKHPFNQNNINQILSVEAGPVGYRRPRPRP